MTTTGSTPNFARDIRPLLRESDRESMDFAFGLWDYNDVRTQAEEILERRTEGSCRATMSLARLWIAQHRSDDARWQLSDVYAWFTEGFETPDLQAARLLLAHL